jgi:DNA-binding transcriptional ArsR family regulator
MYITQYSLIPMPMTSDTGPDLHLTFGTSVPAELLFLTSAIRRQLAEPGAGQRRAVSLVVAGREVPRSLAREVNDFWGDETLFWELFVLADTAGDLLGDLPPESLATSWEAACDLVPIDPPLRSEPEHDRTAITTRLRRLRAEPSLRRRYLRMIADLWALYHDDWAKKAASLVQPAIEQCEARAGRGESWQAVLQSASTSSEILDAGWERARERKVATVAVCVYGGSFEIDLPSTELFGMSVKDRPPLERELPARLARRLKALSDPTRLTLLQLLGGQPRTVGELADAVGIAQPTVSNHVKMLREAGVVRRHDDAAAEGRRLLDVDREAVAALFREVAGLLGS